MIESFFIIFKILNTDEEYYYDPVQKKLMRKSIEIKHGISLLVDEKLSKDNLIL